MILYLILDTLLLDTFSGDFFLKLKPGADPEILRREGGELILLDMAYFMITLVKRGRERALLCIQLSS